ncbi:MAG: FmdB family zinc ribbon protein [Terracidiphilus sp.]
MCDFYTEGVNALPLYAYRCTQCGHRFEKIQNFSAVQELICPVCQGVLERPLTAPRLHFKGGGFYVNDYAGKSDAPAAESASADIKTPCGGSCGAACPAVAAASSASTGDSPKK